MGDMDKDGLVLAALTKVEGEMARVRDSVHGLRGEVTSKVSALELAHAEMKGQIKLLENQIGAMNEKFKGYDTGIDRRFREHEERQDTKTQALREALESSIAALRISLEGAITMAKTDVSNIRMTAKNWLVLFIAPFGFLILQMLGKKLGWL